MKPYLYIPTVTVIALCATSNAASIVGTGTPAFSGNLTRDFFIENTSDVLVGSGFAGLGGFSITDSDVTTAISNNNFTGLFSAFTPFVGSDDFATGLVGLNGGASPGGYGVNNGNFTVTPHIGQTIYTFIGNALTLANSTQVALFKHTQLLVADPGGTATPLDYVYDLSVANGNLLIGSRDSFVGLTDSNFGLTNATVNTVKLAAVTVVPEPSSILLSGLGMVALLRRKR